MPQLRVCVIGAGAAGLAAARHLTSELDVFEVRVFEQASRVGGIWVYVGLLFTPAFTEISGIACHFY